VPRANRSRGGRPPFDHVLIFKALILQASHRLSDERTEFLIKDGDALSRARCQARAEGPGRPLDSEVVEGHPPMTVARLKPTKTWFVVGQLMQGGAKTGWAVR
jgi:hypothetical protein